MGDVIYDKQTKTLLTFVNTSVFLLRELTEIAVFFIEFIYGAIANEHMKDHIFELRRKI